MNLDLAHRWIFTENCNKNCSHCFNASERHGKQLDKKKYFKWLELNASHLGNAELKIFGGEPTIHPDFIELIEKSLDYYGSVSLFTNGTNQKLLESSLKIMRAHYQNRFHFIINFHTAPTFNTNPYNLVQYHVVVSNDDKKFKKQIDKIIRYSQIPNAHFIISGDTNVNLFDDELLEEYQLQYVRFWQYVITYIQPRYSFDHTFPNCFWEQDMLDALKKLGVGPVHIFRPSCCDRIIGLISADGDLTYCNQTRIDLNINVFDKTVPEITDLIQTAPQMKIDLVKKLNKKCRACSSVVTCKTACWCRQMQ